jgi:hypothetical protein
MMVDPTNSIVPKLLAGLKVETVPDLKHFLIELRARYVWLAAALLNIIVPIVAIILSIATIRSYVKGAKLVWTVVIGLLLCVGNLGYLFYSAETKNALYQLVFGFTYDMLTRSGALSSMLLLHVYMIIALINVLAAITPILLLLAVCGILALPQLTRNYDPMDLAQRMRRLKEIIYVGSAFLVIGILHMSMWLNWSSSLVSDPELSSGFSNLAWSVSAYWGVAFTLVLALTYVPSTVYLQIKARELITTGKKAMGAKEAEQWLTENGLSFTINNQLTQGISILAPILAGPIIDIVIKGTR